MLFKILYVLVINKVLQKNLSNVEKLRLILDIIAALSFTLKILAKKKESSTISNKQKKGLLCIF